MSAAVEGAGQDLVPSYPAGEVIDSMREELKRAEARIRNGFGAAYAGLVETGAGLIDVSERKLYRAFTEEEGRPQTFDEYCQRRLKMDKSHAYHLMNLARVEAIVSTMVDALPIPNERVARELSPVLRDSGPEVVAEMWDKVTEKFREGPPPTYRDVHKLLVEEEVRPKPGRAAGGKLKLAIIFGTVSARVGKLERRVDGFLTLDLKGRKDSPETRALALRDADRLQVVVDKLREYGGGEGK